jgi:hypothetical protein
VTGATGYEIDRQDSSGNWQEYDAVQSGTATGYTDSGVQDGVAYTYRVLPYNDSGTSDQTSAPTASATTPLIKPNNIVAVPLSSTSVEIMWDDASSSEKSFIVQRLLNGADDGEPASVNAGTTNYIDPNAQPNTTYTYAVSASNDTGVSTATICREVSTPAPATDAPTNVVATATGPTTIDLSWSESASGVTGYTIHEFLEQTTDWRNTSETFMFPSLSPVGTVDVSGSTTGATVNVTSSYSFNSPGVPDYVFEVTADDAGGTSPLSAPSAPILTLTDPSVTPPDAPNFGAGSSTVMLSNEANLTDPTPPLDSNGMVFNVGDDEVSDSGSDDQPVGAYLLLQQPNHTYSIEARAYNAGGYSAWSSPETFVTPSFSPDPRVSDLAATAVSSTAPASVSSTSRANSSSFTSIQWTRFGLRTARLLLQTHRRFTEPDKTKQPPRGG